MWELFIAGGPLMWPILLCSVLALAIVAERLWVLRPDRVCPPDLARRVQRLVEANQVTDKVTDALAKGPPLGRLLRVALQHRHRPREVLRERLEDTGREVVHDLERYLPMLGTIAGVAPLLGLLGTVTGIIKAFDTLSAGGGGGARLLSGGIAEALVTTAAGLIVAIPALVATRALRSRVDRLVLHMEREAGEFVDALGEARPDTSA
jgi:biopolymer transport protein ExbB